MSLRAFLRSKSNGNEATVRRYETYIKRFVGWLGSRKLTAEIVPEYADYLAGKYRVNSTIPMVVALNLCLEHRGVPFRFKMPSKQVNPNPRLVSDEEYRAILSRIAEPDERLVVRLLHDSLLRPSDVAALRLSELDLSGRFAYIRKTTQKAGVNTESMLTPETAAELRALIAERGIADYIFPSPKRTGPRCRTWPNAVLAKHGAEGISPRTFRRTGATRWNDDTASLMAQGGWKDPKTIFRHYRRNVEERHAKAFEQAMNVHMTADDAEDVPGYR